MIKALEDLREKAESDLRTAGTEDALLTVRTKYLGRKGLLTAILRNIGQVAPEERGNFGNAPMKSRKAFP